jgi:hypothetical protein
VEPVIERGHEGYVAKDERSVYEGGEAVVEAEAEGLDRRGGGGLGLDVPAL